MRVQIFIPNLATINRSLDVSTMAQTMVVAHNLAGIESHDEHEELRENRRAAEGTLLQGFQETNNQDVKTLRDRARELIVRRRRQVPPCHALHIRHLGRDCP